MKQFEISSSVRKALCDYLNTRNLNLKAAMDNETTNGDDSENLFFGKNENLFLDEKRFDDGIYQYAFGCRR